jgi:hypothetical protein
MSAGAGLRTAEPTISIRFRRFGLAPILITAYRQWMAERPPSAQFCPVCKSRNIERVEGAPVPNTYRCLNCRSEWTMVGSLKVN